MASKKLVNNVDGNENTYSRTIFVTPGESVYDTADGLDYALDYVAEYKLVRVCAVIRPSNVKVQTYNG